jgi:hypothetical protein
VSKTNTRDTTTISSLFSIRFSRVKEAEKVRNKKLYPHDTTTIRRLTGPYLLFFLTSNLLNGVEKKKSRLLLAVFFCATQKREERHTKRRRRKKHYSVSKQLCRVWPYIKYLILCRNENQPILSRRSQRERRKRVRLQQREEKSILEELSVS